MCSGSLRVPLRWGRVDLVTGKLQVEETCYKGVLGTPKTRASRREVPLPTVVLQALLAHRERSLDTSPEALVFTSRNGKPANADNLLKRELRPACKLVGINRIDWHSLRRTHGTLLHALGTPLKVTQAQLGHSYLPTTLEVYTQALVDAQRDAVSKLEQLLFPNVPKFETGQEVEDEKTLQIQ